MAIITTVVNILIIIVLSNNTRLSNSQSKYKISLAAADLLVGVFVIPTSIYSLYAVVSTQLTTEVTRNTFGYQLVNTTYEKIETPIIDNIDENLRKNALTPAYIDTVGFITAISIFVSVYTFAGAGLDRFKAVYHPFTYNKTRAQNIAKLLCLFSWVIAAVFSAIPIFISADILKYGINFSLIVATLDFNGIILYVVIFFIPLLVVWLVNISVYVVIKRHHNLQRRVSTSTRSKNEEIERKLAATLQLMVGVFTFNTLPLWLTFFGQLFIPSLMIQRPETLNPMAVSIFITVKAIAVLLLLGNSLCNFFIYNNRSEEFQKTFKQILRDKVGLSKCCIKTLSYVQNVSSDNRKTDSTV